jgi:hypothetical protein
VRKTQPLHVELSGEVGILEKVSAKATGPSS